MKLLSISGILPIPDLIKENDIIFKIYDHYREAYPETEVHFIRTIVYSNYLLAAIKDKWNRYYQAIQKGRYIDRGYPVTIFPHFIFQCREDLFTLLAKNAYYQNLDKVQHFTSFDLIHAQRIFPEGYLARKMSEELDIPYVLTVRKESNYFNGSYAERRARKIMEGASQITTLNPEVHAFFSERYPGKTMMIPHGVEERFFNAESQNKNEERIEILTVAKLWEYKRIEAVVETLSQLKDQYNFKYTIIGEGPRLESIRQCIREHNMQSYVEMIGRVPHEDIPSWYAAADIFVLVSYPETFGRVYFEAMASGTPIVCSRNSGVDGLFVEGESGFAVDHQKPDELRDVLEYLIQHKDAREKIGRAGQQLVRKYTWPKIVESYNAVYQQALINDGVQNKYQKLR